MLDMINFLPGIGSVLISIIVAFVAIGLIFARLYRR